MVLLEASVDEGIRYADYFFIFALTNVVAGFIYLAWRLTCRPTLAYNVHLIQTYQSASQQRVQIINADPERVNADDLVSLITDETNSLDQTSNNNSSSDYSLRIRALVVRSPSRSSESQNVNLSQDTTLIELPLNTNRHISSIYQTIQRYTDPSIAGAVVVSLFRGYSRRLSNQNHLQIAQLLTEVGSDTEVASSARNQYAYTFNIGDQEETISTDSSTISSTMSSPDESDLSFLNDATTPSSEQVNTTNESNNADQPTETTNQAPSMEAIGEHTIKLKFLDDTEQIVKTKLSATVIEFKKAYFADQVSSGKTIRLIFRGQLLRDDNRSMESYGLEDNSIVHCHINNKPYAQSTTQHTSSNHTGHSNDQSNYGSNPILTRPVFDEVANESFLMRMLRMGVYYADIVPFILFYAMTASLAWIREVESIPDDPTAPFLIRQLTRIRRSLYVALRVFVDFNEQSNINEDIFSNRFNLGVLFTLLFAVKFMSIWLVVIYFPQYTDAKGVFILLVLTVVFGLYTFQNRPIIRSANSNNQQQGTANEIHIR